MSPGSKTSRCIELTTLPQSSADCLEIWKLQPHEGLGTSPGLYRDWFTFGGFFCHILTVCLFVCFWHNSPQWARASSLMRFLDHTQRRNTVSRTPLDEWSARRRILYLKTHNTLNLQTYMPPVGFEPTIPASERPQDHALDRAATGTGIFLR